MLWAATRIPGELTRRKGRTSANFKAVTKTKRAEDVPLPYPSPQTFLHPSSPIHDGNLPLLAHLEECRRGVDPGQDALMGELLEEVERDDVLELR